MEGVNLIMIYCEHYVTVTVYPLYNYNMLIIIIKKKETKLCK
jgi:hypothetical protein